ncbi:MAG: arylsulfatase [Phycisphaeraceae bacterium]|nr:arylsulfatase [Phycisphaeraceae bacterium]
MLSFFLLAAMLVCPPSLGDEAKPKPSVDKPNIVYIIADDQGWGDAGCNNPDSKIPTPGIDRIAGEGMRFTDAHSASAVCTPTRYALLTGRYAWRTRLQKGVLTGDKEPLIAESTKTIGSFLKGQGYQTACIGKWHLGFRYELPVGTKIKSIKALGGTASVPIGSKLLGGPTTRGFDTFMGFHHAREMATWMVGDEVTENIHVNQMLPRITQAAVDYIDERAGEKDIPFFLYLPLSAPHTPIVPIKPWLGSSILGQYGDFVMQTDGTVVRVLEALDRNRLTDNTLVIFTADNGCAPPAKVEELRQKGHDPMAGLRGHKADVWEGGHRVPFVVRWPGVVEPGAETDEPICLNSLMATCAQLLNVELAEDEGVDSFSILPVLRGEKINEPTHPVIVHHSIKGKFAIRIGDWKYLHCKGSGGWSKGGDGRPAQLYNLKADRGEQNNLVNKEPRRTDTMRQTLMDVIDRGRSTLGPKQDNDVLVSP